VLLNFKLLDRLSKLHHQLAPILFKPVNEDVSSTHLKREVPYQAPQLWVSPCKHPQLSWRINKLSDWPSYLGPAVKVPGLVFCAGQTATGEIKQATVSLIAQALIRYQDTGWPIVAFIHIENRSAESEGSSWAFWFFPWTGRQVQCLPRRYEGFRRHERSLHRFPPTAHAIALMSSSSCAWKWHCHWDWVYCASLIMILWKWLEYRRKFKFILYRELAILCRAK
jgi:hypothetical protein